MSRIGLKPIPIPQGVTVTQDEGHLVSVKGPKGELSRIINPEMQVDIGETLITVTRPSESKLHKAQHGLSRTLIANMVEGVSAGFIKELAIAGVGYKAMLKGTNLELALGFSHPVIVKPGEGITFEVPSPTEIKVLGYNKELVGQTAANIRSWRPPEPFKGKGIRYKGEHIIRTAGKASAKEG